MKNLKLGAVELNVQHMVQMRAFYQHVIGLEVIKEFETEVHLGLKNNSIIHLIQESELSPAHPTHAGLYHVAILYAARSELSKALQRVFTHSPHLFSGSADHLVSEAFYLNDPEGNGIELYFDRDAKAWQWENGQVKMAAMYIDPKEYMQLHLTTEEQNPDRKVGHVHLKVGNIQEAKKFYVDILGFAITAQMPSALFISVDNYHHHIGMNTWESEGAGQRPNTLGLRSFELQFSDPKEVAALQESLEQHSIAFEKRDGIVRFSDPWGNILVVK